MPITASATFNVDPLTDNEIAFANAAAWNNYFSAVPVDIELAPITVTIYGPVAYVDSAPYDLTIDGGDRYVFPSLTQFNSLLAAYTALANNYQLLRAELYAAGLISQP